MKTIRCREIYTIHSPQDGFVKPERYAEADDPRNNIKNKDVAGESLDFNELTYPSGYILPFHYKHPVTGQETAEKARNSNLGTRGKNEG